MGEPVVIVKQGKLRGAVVENIPGKSFISFEGIPFAASPVGNLRFADPQPPQSWTGIRDALQEGPVCAQADFFTKSIIGDDDCLYLNVATTSLTGSRPVMVWIHGGAFIVGDGSFSSYGPDSMIGSGIVYVGINYRVGVLDFSKEGRLTTVSDIEQYFTDENTSKNIREVNLRNVTCLDSGQLLETCINKALNLVAINIHGTKLKGIQESRSFLEPLMHVKRLSIDWPNTVSGGIVATLQRPCSTLVYLSVGICSASSFANLTTLLELCQELKEMLGTKVWITHLITKY